MQAISRSISWALTLLVLGCSAPRHADTAPPVTAPPQPTTAEPAPVGVVDATILFTDCAAVSDMNAKLAERTMRRLVEACDSVPTGKAQFVATLVPGGRIEISVAEGADSTVPICVLKHQLQHQVQVKKACKMQIQMEQKPAEPAAATGTSTAQ